ncbi:MAG: indole-3-glycerol phosphate synthase TrpC [Candidatus Margulisiibacteriota bacterium]
MNSQPTSGGILEEIVFSKRQEVTSLKVRLEINKVKKLMKELPRPRNFLKAFTKGKISLIAEIKKASPSAGVIVEKYEPVYLAKTYEECGASAISVLTDAKYFQGKIEDLKAAKESTTVPILRKDFIIDESQIYESRIYGADAVLLIARILNSDQLLEFMDTAQELKMKCLVEVHNEAELEQALKADAEIIGINNRDLDNMTVDFNTTLRLLEKYPQLKDKIVVSESGINSSQQVKLLRDKGVWGILVGESLLKSGNIPAKVRELMG